jgi:hypothetical protein
MPNSLWPKEARQVQNTVKSMLVFDTEGIVQKEFIPLGQIMNVYF